MTRFPLGSSSFQDIFITGNYVNEELEIFVEKKFQRKHEDHWMTIQSTIKIINWPYKIMADRRSIL